MKTVRQSSWEQGIRINYVAPCWIRSAIRTKEYETWLIEHGIEFGEQADCAGAMMRIACDKRINGTFLFLSGTLLELQCLGCFVSCPACRAHTVQGVRS